MANRNSLICAYIENNLSDWRATLPKKEIKITEKDGLAIFNYGIYADFGDPLVQEARGIIIDLETLSPVCWPFRKFGNYQEDYADDIDWSTTKVQEKIDGSLVKLFYYKDKWRWASNSAINAEDVDISGVNMMGLIKSADNYKDIDEKVLDTGKTYMFELVSPVNRIVVKYPACSLYHIGTRDNVSGKEEDADIGIKKPDIYDIHTMEACIDFAENKLNSKDDTEAPEHEGFVVVDGAYNRVKVKSPKYLFYHHAKNNGVPSKKNMIFLILNAPEKAKALAEEFPDLAVFVKYYSYKVEEVFLKCDMTAGYARSVYEEYSHERGPAAMKIKELPLKAIGFEALNCQLSGREIFLKKFGAEKMSRLIPDCPLVDIRKED